MTIIINFLFLITNVDSKVTICQSEEADARVIRLTYTTYNDKRFLNHNIVRTIDTDVLTNSECLVFMQK